MKVATLLSGGMDSFALTYQYKPDYAVTIDYGHKPAKSEIEASARLAKHLNIEHIIISIDLSSLGSGDLTDKPAIDGAPASDWWPFRNQALITIAAMKLVSLEVRKLLIGTVGSDSVHKDGTVEFIESINALLSMQEGGMTVDAPAISLATVDLVRASKIPYSLLAWSHSCHTSNIACGQCRGCIKHRIVTEELGFAEL